jgi:glycosyltransferase involved in cell wall biosynthesis
LDALQRHQTLSDLRVDVYGHGSEMDTLQARAAHHPNVHLHGFVPDAANLLADHDLLLHTCAEEPFGLAVLEAMAARVPVLVPNAGGAGSLIENGVSGFHFAANDPTHLGQVLQRLMHTPACQLNAVVKGAQHALAHRFAPQRGLTDYTRLLEQPHAI